jgi:hypothetical protein
MDRTVRSVSTAIAGSPTDDRFGATWWTSAVASTPDGGGEVIRVA